MLHITHTMKKSYLFFAVVLSAVMLVSAKPYNTKYATAGKNGSVYLYSDSSGGCDNYGVNFWVSESMSKVDSSGSSNQGAYAVLSIYKNDWCSGTYQWAVAEINLDNFDISGKLQNASVDCNGTLTWYEYSSQCNDSGCWSEPVEIGKEQVTIKTVWTGIGETTHGTDRYATHSVTPYGRISYTSRAMGTSREAEVKITITSDSFSLNAETTNGKLGVWKNSLHTISKY